MLKYLNDGEPLEKWVGQRNLARQYDFMNSTFVLWQSQGRPLVSFSFLQELNFYAVHLLSPCPGVFRNKVQQNVDIRGTPHNPPPWEEVEHWMAEFLSTSHRLYKEASAMHLAAYALWRLNWIHPFAQGNGRTSRALCYFLLCQRYDKWFPGLPILPELIRQNRDEYCELLRETDGRLDGENMADLSAIEAFLERLLLEQLESAIREQDATQSAAPGPFPLPPRPDS